MIHSHFHLEVAFFCLGGGTEVTYQYDASRTRLEGIAHNGFQYGFTYDKYGNVLSTSVAGKTLSTNTYGANNGKLTKTTYGNGDYRSYVYTKAGDISSESVNGTKVASWTYDYGQQPLAYKDLIGNQEHTYAYDSTGRLLESKTFDMGITSTAKDSLLYRTMYGYDTMDRVEKLQVTAGGRDSVSEYRYNENGKPAQTILGAERAWNYNYDTMGRLISKELSLGSPLLYNYRYHLSARNGEGETIYQTTQLKDELLGNTGYRYTYDVMGNITSIAEGTRNENGNTINNPTVKVNYEYDSKNQLVRENNLYLDQTIVYTYDNGGNISSKKIYAYTTSNDLTSVTVIDEVLYTYASDWKDQMVSYDGQTVEYDAIGNPTSYRGKTMEWTGRTLDKITQNGTEITYRYDASGLRTGKVVGTEETEYYYAGGKLAYEKRGNKEFHYRYDADGTLASIQYVDGTGTSAMYYPAVNSRDDVEALYNDAGELQARYSYDSWGKVISITDANGAPVTDENHIGNLNAIRYRGYYYDAETGFYYVSSRYYDPEIGRFLNTDTTDILFEEDDLLQYNLYSYCFNNPVNMVDFTGESPSQIIGAIAGGIGGYALGKLLAKELGLKGAKRNALIAAATLGGAALGAFLGPYASKLGKKVFSAVKNYGKKIACKVTKKGCFVAGTKILTKDGEESIEEVKKGDWVYSENPKTGKQGIRKVVQTYINESDELVHIYVDEEEIVATPEHPFYVRYMGWVGASELREGDVLVLQSGQYVNVDNVKHEILEEPIEVYNFEVEEFHTYYVGDNNILVHNMCAKKADIKQIEDAAKRAGIKDRRAFGDYVEWLKKGKRNNANFTFKELLKIAEEFKEL